MGASIDSRVLCWSSAKYWATDCWFSIHLSSLSSLCLCCFQRGRLGKMVSKAIFKLRCMTPTTLAHRASDFIIACNQAGQTWFAFLGWLLLITHSFIFTEVKLPDIQLPKSSFLPFLRMKTDSCLTLRPTSSSSRLGWFSSSPEDLNTSSFFNLLLLYFFLPHSFLECACTGKGLGVGFDCENRQEKDTDFISFFIDTCCHWVASINRSSFSSNLLFSLAFSQNLPCSDQCPSAPQNGFGLPDFDNKYLTPLFCVCLLVKW